MPPPDARRGPIVSALLGMGRVARGRVDGLALFDATPGGFLASLAPVVAFALVGAGLMALRGSVMSSLVELASTAVILLAPLVVSEWLATRWGRGAAWLRFATAFNWCQWAMPAAVMAGLLAAFALILLGLPPELAKVAAVGVVLAYGLWLEWFIARHTLELGRGRSLMLVMIVNAVTAVLALAPHLLAGASDG